MMDALQRDQTGVFDTKRLIGDDAASNGRSASGSTSSGTVFSAIFAYFRAFRLNFELLN